LTDTNSIPGKTREQRDIPRSVGGSPVREIKNSLQKFTADEAIWVESGKETPDNLLS
jgi:hypothetical protein